MTIKSEFSTVVDFRRALIELLPYSNIEVKAEDRSVYMDITLNSKVVKRMFDITDINDLSPVQLAKIIVYNIVYDTVQNYTIGNKVTIKELDKILSMFNSPYSAKYIFNIANKGVHVQNTPKNVYKDFAQEEVQAVYVPNNLHKDFVHKHIIDAIIEHNSGIVATK